MTKEGNLFHGTHSWWRAPTRPWHSPLILSLSHHLSLKFFSTAIMSRYIYLSHFQPSLPPSRPLRDNLATNCNGENNHQMKTIPTFATCWINVAVSSLIIFVFSLNTAEDVFFLLFHLCSGPHSLFPSWSSHSVLFLHACSFSSYFYTR